MRKKTFRLTGNSKFGITAVLVLILVIFTARVVIKKSSGSRKAGKPSAPSASSAKTYSDPVSETEPEKSVTVGKKKGRDFVKDAEKALNAADSEKLKNIIVAWVKKNPDAAIQWVKQIPEDSKCRNCALNDLTIAMVKVDIGTALQLLEELPPDWREIAVPNLVIAWAEEDPEAAAKFLEQSALKGDISQEGIFSRPAATVAAAWAKKDLDSAFQWAQTLPSGARDSALGAVALEMGKKDLGATAKCLQEISNTTLRRHTLEALIPELAKTDPMVAIRWLEELPDEIYQPPPLLLFRPKKIVNYRSKIFFNLASEWAKQNPEAAVNWVGNLSIPQEEKDEILSRIHRTH